jgi:uncharacterized membrane protein SirB2
VSYVLLKQIHMAFALVSIIGFVLRWGWKMNGSGLSQLRLTKTVPHVVDTLFLASGVALVFTIHQYPLTTAWLTAKIAGLLAYIVLGMFAMSAKAPRTWQITSFIAAISTYAWIYSVARTKSALGFIEFL